MLFGLEICKVCLTMGNWGEGKKTKTKPPKKPKQNKKTTTATLLETFKLQKRQKITNSPYEIL